MTRFLLSAYPALPTPATSTGTSTSTSTSTSTGTSISTSTSTEVRELYARLRDTPGVTAIELPLDADGAVPGADVVLPLVPDHWDVLLTTVPGTMARLVRDPVFGTASDDLGGADRASDHLAACLRTAARVDDALGRPAVTGVAVVSAPRRRDGQQGDGQQRDAADRFAGRLAAAWRTAPAHTVPLVEHCDAPVPGQVPAKGFLDLDAEIRAVEALRRAGQPGAGLLVNWGRSAIEARSVDGPVTHVARARAAGVLAGVVLSGCSDRDSTFGPAWADAHLPPADLPRPAGEPTSLLTRPALRRVLAAAGEPRVVGAKFAVRPHDVSPAARARAVAAAVEWVRAVGAGRNV